MQFPNVLKSYLLEKGDVARKDLIQAPFTALHPDGIRGLFPTGQINEIIQLTQTIAA